MELSVIIDIAIVAIVVLFAIIGLIKGFFKSLISLFGIVLSLIISIVLAQYLVNVLLPLGPVNLLFGTDGIISTKLHDTLIGWSPIFSSNVGNAEQLTEAGIPAIISGILASAIAQTNLPFTDKILADVIAPALANALFYLIITTILFIILRIILSIFDKITKKLTRNKTINGLNRLFGFLVGIVKGAAMVFVAFAALFFFAGMPFMASFNDNLANSSIGKPVSDWTYNIVGELTKGYDLGSLLPDFSKKPLTPAEILVKESLTGVEFADDLDETDLDADTKAAYAALKASHDQIVARINGGNTGLNDEQLGTMLVKAETLKAAVAELNDKIEAYTDGDTAAKAEIDGLIAGIAAAQQSEFIEPLKITVGAESPVEESETEGGSESEGDGEGEGE